MSDIRKLLEAIDTLSEDSSTTPKQAYEWVKTGHWGYRQFSAWLIEWHEAHLLDKTQSDDINFSDKKWSADDSSTEGIPNHPEPF